MGPGQDIQDRAFALAVHSTAAAADGDCAQHCSSSRWLCTGLQQQLTVHSIAAAMQQLLGVQDRAFALAVHCIAAIAAAADCAQHCFSCRMCRSTTRTKCSMLTTLLGKFLPLLFLRMFSPSPEMNRHYSPNIQRYCIDGILFVFLYMMDSKNLQLPGSSIALHCRYCTVLPSASIASRLPSNGQSWRGARGIGGSS